jgi:hypothetical protein
VLAERLADTIRPGLADHTGLLVDKPDRTRGGGYYTAFALRITADQGETELGDGGLTTWTAQLTDNAKERCLVSCIATERLAALAEQPADTAGRDQQVASTDVDEPRQP